MYVRAAKRVKISPRDVRDAALLGKLGHDLATTEIDLPFDGKELSCWTEKNRISEMTVSELVSGIKVRNLDVLHCKHPALESIRYQRYRFKTACGG